MDYLSVNEDCGIDPQYVRGFDIDDIAIEIKHCGFDEAVNIIGQQSAKYEPYLVLVVGL